MSNKTLWINWKLAPGIRGLSIRQPWAWAIVNGFKPVENRDWNYKPTYRGPLLIHASKTFDFEGWQFIQENFPGLPLPGGESISTKKGLKGHFRTGGFVGLTRLSGVIEESPNPWFFGPLGFQLEAAVRVEFLPFKGRLNLFKVPKETLNQITII